MINEIEESLELIKKNLIKQFNPLAIILFGSFSRNLANDNSDIDIAFISNDFNKKKLFDIKQELQNKIQRDIDLININFEDIYDSFKYEVLINGIVLYCDNEYEYDLYKIRTIKEYLELNEGRKDIIERIRNGGTIYGE